MIAIALASLRDLKHRWVLALFMAILFSITYASYVSLITYEASISKMHLSLDANWLVVDEGFGGGEFHGSRISPEVGDLLKSYGYEPIPEINQAVGTSTSNAILMRGVPPEYLYTVNPFELVSGRALQPGDDARLAMGGSILATRLELEVGENINLRGRDFLVIGLFTTGSYADNQVWISLTDAQELLGYGSDVSIYYIPDGGILQAGASPEQGVIIFEHGEAGQSYKEEVMKVYRYLGLVGVFLGIATLITLTNTLWRLAWLHRRQFGIIRALGFGKWAVAFYLFIQAALILFIGTIFGGTFAFSIVLSQITSASHFGLSFVPSWDLNTITMIVFLTSLFAGIGVFLPTARINRMNIPELLRKA